MNMRTHPLPLLAAHVIRRDPNICLIQLRQFVFVAGVARLRSFGGRLRTTQSDLFDVNDIKGFARVIASVSLRTNL